MLKEQYTTCPLHTTLLIQPFIPFLTITLPPPESDYSTVGKCVFGIMLSRDYYWYAGLIDP